MNIPNDPYSTFKDDRLRLLALALRDRRLLAVTMIRSAVVAVLGAAEILRALL